MKTICSKSPAQNWEQAFPVGNGRLGAMVWGNPAHEVIQLNEESIWSSSFIDRNNPSCRKSLQKINAFVKEGRNAEVQDLIHSCFNPIVKNHAMYQTAGELHIDFFLAEGAVPYSECSGYKRSLDFETGVANTTFTSESPLPSTAIFSSGRRGSSIEYYRDVFVSQTQDVVIIHIGASTPKSIHLRASFDRGNFVSKAIALADDTIALQDTHGIPFTLMATAVCSGGRVKTSGANLIVDSADEVVIYIDVQSAWRKGSYNMKKGNVHSSQNSLATWSSDFALKKLCFASSCEYSDSYKEHVSEFSELFNQEKLTLDSAEESSVFIEDILSKSKEKSSFANELFWNWCRYLHVSSLKKNEVPGPGYWGLWNNSFDSEQGKAGVSLDSLNFAMGQELPSALLKRIYKNGKKTARVMFGMEGFAAFDSTDLWGDSAPLADGKKESIVPLGGIKIATFIRDCYERTLDAKFLRKNFYVIKSACEFFADFLSRDFVLSDEEKNLIAKLFDCAISCCTYLKLEEKKSDAGKWKALRDSLSALPTDDGAKASKQKKSKEFPAVFEKEFSPLFFAGKCLYQMNSGVVQSEYKDGVLQIELLPGLSSAWKNGRLEGVRVKGNLTLNIEWKDGNLKSADLTAVPASRHAESVCVTYKGKAYEAAFSENSLDILNVLPTTI
ncbi:MAG: glycoside hydrolase family 95 protein [Treponema sp.]|nr:glycoside hydrolase family 95 protein [Treponema sp.]